MFKLSELHASISQLAVLQQTQYPVCPNALPGSERHSGRYVMRFARTRAELDAVLKLRFEVFNLELGEGLATSFLTGRDLDEFDESCHHLMVVETETGQVIGTYRMQTSEMAARGQGFYAAHEFALEQLPAAVRNNAVELGRACVAQAHRHASVLWLLWQGLADYLRHNRKRYLFGCCSLTSQAVWEGRQVSDLLKAEGHMHPQFLVSPRPAFACTPSTAESVEGKAVKLPRLFRTYLRYGAQVCSPPALDRQFKTIDYLVLFDAANMDEETIRRFF
jgi:putative hemolysin